ncbi:MAG: hypothetical protein R2827_06775 [Bdellovibrionales bacterium]
MNEPLDRLTVGSIYKINCSGDFVDHSRKNLQIILDKKSEYQIYLLEVLDDSPTSVLAQVTSYKPGPLKDLEFTFADGAGVSWPVRGVDVEIQSVIDPQKGPPQPFGPMGPIKASLEWWFYAFFISLGIVVLGLLLRKTFRIVRKKNFFINNDIEPEQAWLRAFGIKSRKGIFDKSKDRQVYLEFNKTIRELTKKLPQEGKAEAKDIAEFCESLKNRYDKYYTQMLWVPVKEMSMADLLREIKWQDRRFYQRHAAEIKRVKSEIDRSVKQPEKMSAYDCQQLLQMSRKSAALIYNYKKGGKEL